MIRILHRIVKFCDKKNAKRIRIAYIFAFLNALMKNASIMVAIYLIKLLFEGNKDVLTCVKASGILILAFALTTVFSHITDRLQSSSGYKVFADKRIEFAAKLRTLPMGYFTEGTIGRISSILSEDMVFVEENSMSIIAEIVSDIFSQALLVVFMFILNPLLGAIALITVIIVLFISIPMNKEGLKNSLNRQSAVENLTGAVIEYAEGMAVSKSFGLTGESSEKIRDAFKESREANLRFEREHSPWTRRMEIVYALGLTGIFMGTIYLCGENKLEFANFIGVLLFLMNMFVPFKHMFAMGSRLTIMDIALNRIEAVLSEKPLDLSGSEKPKGDSENEIEFKNVSFSYETKEVLHDISFSVKKNQMIALVGESGCGKTTIANLISRFWDVDKGEVLFRGINIKKLTMEYLMSNLSMVFQKVYLFEDTVFNNISMGKPDATYEEVVSAAKKARCYDFIMNLPYGFDTIVGEGGANLSGGEAQRISIARCILKDAPIIILDEATASIDADNECYIKEAMSELCKDKTVIVIAHRLNTIKEADNIMVISEGRVAESGSHEWLMKQNGIYKSMVIMQEESYRQAEEIGA
ncbi:MAG: ABC transporter ATP-binding protein/permease [Lachnospiraceae bacterium]|nr:ABC transporter ATP-binding protein/permease [Lachnospiraceae bacterium]